MNCTRCGAPLESDAKFCNVCGSPVEAPATQGGYVPGSTENYTPGSTGGYTPGSEGGYTQGSTGGYTPGSTGGYTPGGGNYTPGGSGGRAVFVEPSVVRKYFLNNRVLPWVLIILGIPFITMLGLGLILIIIGIVMLFRESYAGEASVDQAWRNQIERLEARSLEKLNLIHEQTSIIDPVTLVGFGEGPDSTFTAAKAESKARRGHRFGLFRWIFSFLKKADGTELDPEEVYKIGSDDRLRSLLLEVSTFVFTDTQVLMYRADVDISTGLIYRELTSECFYQEIEAMNFTESLYKVFNRRRKKYVNQKRESFVLYMGGCSFSASMGAGGENESVLAEKFTAMRSLIREKKHA